MTKETNAKAPKYKGGVTSIDIWLPLEKQKKIALHLEKKLNLSSRKQDNTFI